MKKTYRIENLGCANCAAKMERGIAALDGVAGCSLSFLTGKLVIEGADDRFEGIEAEARKIVRKTEPGATMQ